MSKVYWPLYEVFVRSKQGLSHRHVGSLHAADDQMALENARDAYTRRSEGCSIWVVKASEIVASQVRVLRGVNKLSPGWISSKYLRNG
ncbi:phenylacetic acid degradation protein paaB [Klebsiella variicola]|nr:phenylacetic acid degradation protein paaB [Klebsiella variicola]